MTGSTPAVLRLRSARDHLIDLLGLGQTYPVRDLPVAEDRLTIPYGDTATVRIDLSQADVRYDLRDHSRAAVTAAEQGTGGLLQITTPTVTDDITFTIRATKPSGRAANLLTPASIKVGLDLSLDAVLSATGPVDFGAVVTASITASQDGVDYHLIRFAGGDPAAAEEAMSSVLRGTGERLDLVSKPMDEDCELRIRATKVFDPALKRPTISEILAVRLPILVRPDPALAVAIEPAAVIAYGEAASIKIAASQKSCRYQAFVHAIADAEYRQGGAPSPLIAAVPVAGTADALVQLPSLPMQGDDLAGYRAFGEDQPGNNGDLSLALPAAVDDLVVAVLASKDHKTASGPQRSLVWLAHPAVVLAGPDPNAALTLKVGLAGGKTIGTIELTGGQPGVFYTPAQSSGPRAGSVAGPGYVHKRDAADATANKGLDQLKLEVDYVIARDPPQPASDLPHAPPLPPLLQSGELAAGTALTIQARKAQTGVTATMAGTANLAPLPAVNADTLVDFGGQAKVVIAASQASEHYSLWQDAQPVAGPVAGNGGALTLLAAAIRQDGVLTISAVSDTAVRVDRRAGLSVSVRPDPSRPVTTQATTVAAGGATEIRVGLSQTGVTYALHANNAAVGRPVAGTGGTITLPTGPIAAATEFSVAAERSDIAGAAATLSQTVSIAVGPS